MLQLSVQERALLAERLIASLDEDAEIEQAWGLEVGQRLAAYEAGNAVAIPAAEAFAKAMNRLK